MTDSNQHSMGDRIADFWEFERDHGWGSVRDEAEKLIRDLEEQLEAAHEEILFLCSDEDDIRKGLREQLEAAREQLAAPRDVTALRVGIDWHSHDGMVTVYDRDGRYLGCMGVERFHRLLAEDAISRDSNPATTSLAK